MLADGAALAVVQKQLRRSDARIPLGMYGRVVAIQPRDAVENVQHASLSSRRDALRSQKRMKAKLIKIIGWTVGVVVGVFLIVDGKMETFHPLRHALIGAAIGLVLGLIFSRKTKATAAN